MQISLLYENTNIIVVVAHSKSLFLIKLNFRSQIVLFITKLFLKQKESPLDVALFLFNKILTALKEVSAYEADQFLSSTCH